MKAVFLLLALLAAAAPGLAQVTSPQQLSNQLLNNPRVNLPLLTASPPTQAASPPPFSTGLPPLTPFPGVPRPPVVPTPPANLPPSPQTGLGLGGGQQNSGMPTAADLLRTLQGQDFTRFGSLAAQLQALPQQQQVQTMTQAFSQALAANPVGNARVAVTAAASAAATGNTAVATALAISIVRTGNTVAIAIAFAEAIRIGNTTFTFAFAEAIAISFGGNCTGFSQAIAQATATAQSQGVGGAASQAIARAQAVSQCGNTAGGAFNSGLGTFAG